MTPARESLPLQTVRRHFMLVLASSGALQFAVAHQPDTMGDVLLMIVWSRKIVALGMMHAYFDSPSLATAPDLFIPINYPPIFPYILFALGHLVNDRNLDFWIRVPAILSNLLIAWIVFAELLRMSTKRNAFWIGTAIAFHPGMIFNSAYWGQIDALPTLAVLGSLAMLLRRKPEFACVLLTLGILTKPLALFALPSIAVWILFRFGWKTALCSAAVSLICALVVFQPFVAANRFPEILTALFARLEIMPYATVNAHNLWWLISAPVALDELQQRSGCGYFISNRRGISRSRLPGHDPVYAMENSW